MGDGKESSAPTIRTDAGATSDRPQRLADGAESAAPTAAAKEVEIGSKFYQVQFRVHVSMRYHQARRAWWVNLNRISSASAALAGSSALIAVFGSSYKEAWAYVSAASGAFAALNSALGFTDRAREHADLYRGFSSIAARMAVATTSDDATGRSFEAEVLQLEAAEPPSIHTLNVVCHNQECEARGLPQEYRCQVSWINRVFKSLGTVKDSFPPMPPAKP